MTERMRIGYISLFYPPMGGGAEIYLKRLIQAMRQSANHLWTMRPQNEDAHDRRDENCAIRFFGESPEINYETLEVWFDQNHSAIFSDILNWAKSTRCELVVVNSPITYFGQTRLLVQALRELCKVGCLIHDVPGQPFEGLLRSYRKTGSWERSLDQGRAELARFSRGDHTGSRSSPFRLETDFTIYNSRWVRNFYDPYKEKRCLVFHPIIERSNHHPRKGLTPVDLTIVNPLPMKGAVLFLALVNFYCQSRRIRVLGGGYNSAVSKMRPFLGGIQSGLFHGDIPENIDVQDTLQNMTEVYENTKVLLHPTRIEGFGMTPAEALLEQCRVITTDLPGIRESVGDAAVKMPYFADPTDWAKAIDAMLSGAVDLEEATRARAAHLKRRQRSELAELKTFFEETISSQA